jgi:hypothetical protein
MRSLESQPKGSTRFTDFISKHQKHRSNWTYPESLFRVFLFLHLLSYAITIYQYPLCELLKYPYLCGTNQLAPGVLQIVNLTLVKISKSENFFGSSSVP